LTNQPLYRRIYDDLRRSITSGDLPPGVRLPSTRALAAQLGVSRNTVIAAYDALTQDGLLIGRIGSGTRVGGPRPARIDLRQVLRESHYPAGAVRFRDPDGNPVYLHG
jgi:GntR family transcriptional regulator/MocR family aminotransferase